MEVETIFEYALKLAKDINLSSEARVKLIIEYSQRVNQYFSYCQKFKTNE